MWTFQQTDGAIFDPAREPFTISYAGAGAGKNNPLLEQVHDVGPLPRGRYTAGPAFHDPHLGADCMRLTPDPENEMFGRGDFLIHADSILHPGMASQGCIVVRDPAKRHLIAISEDREWEVTL